MTPADAVSLSARSSWLHRPQSRLGVACLIVVALTMAGWVCWSQYRTANVEMARSAKVVDSSERLLSRILDAETGQRGFLLTGKEGYLEPYHSAVTAVPQELSNLGKLIAATPGQSAEFARLQALVHQKMAELAETIELRRAAGAKAALEVVLSDRGKSQMDEIRSAIVAIQNGQRSTQGTASSQAEAATLVMLLAAMAAALALLFFFIAGVEPLLDRAPPAVQHPRLIAMGTAVLATALALALRQPMAPVIGPVNALFLTFLPAVLFVSWYAGVRAGASTVLFLASAALYFVFAPSGQSRLERQSSAVALLFFILVGAGIVFLARSQRLAIQRADDEARRRTAAEDAERQQRVHYETTLASIGDAVVSTDAEGRITFVNEVARSILRYPLGELMGRPLDEVFRIVNEHTRLPVESPVAKVLREGQIVGMANHTILIAGDGTEVPLDDSGSPVRGPDGKIRGVVLVFRDVTQRRAAEKLLEEQSGSLRESETVFRTMANTIPQLVCMARADGSVFWYNDRWYEYTGSTFAEMEGSGWQSLHHPRELPEVMHRWRAALAAGTPFEMVFPLRGKDGRYRPFLTRSIPLRDSEGRIVRWLGASTDISDMRRVEARLERANADLARSNADLQQFAYVASHDLQEPLRMITSYAQLLARKYPAQTDESARMMIDQMMSGTARMRDLLQDLLHFAQIGQAGRDTDQIADLSAVVEIVKLNLQDVIEASEAMIECASLPVLRADGTYLTSLFQNLVSNAIKYHNSEPPWIRISAKTVAGELQFAVSDNGIGIAPEFHRRIFDVFQRLHGRDVPGTGLGLAICKRVVERYGGRIWVESHPGAGSTFYFTLPGAEVCEGETDHAACS